MRDALRRAESNGVNAQRGYDFGARLSSSQSWKLWTCNYQSAGLLHALEIRS
jgi:hypothetical protein